MFHSFCVITVVSLLYHPLYDTKKIAIHDCEKGNIIGHMDAREYRNVLENRSFLYRIMQAEQEAQREIDIFLQECDND